MEELSVARLVSICDGGHSLSLEFVIDGDMKAVLTNMILDSSENCSLAFLGCNIKTRIRHHHFFFVPLT